MMKRTPLDLLVDYLSDKPRLTISTVVLGGYLGGVALAGGAFVWLIRKSL